MKKLFLYVFLGLMVCNVGFAASFADTSIKKSDDIRFFGIILGDNITNYETRDWKCDGDDTVNSCGYVVPKINNKSFEMNKIRVGLYPVSNEIFGIYVPLKIDFDTLERCKLNLEQILSTVVKNKEARGFKEDYSFRSNLGYTRSTYMDKGESRMYLGVVCTPIKVKVDSEYAAYEKRIYKLFLKIDANNREKFTEEYESQYQKKIDKTGL